MSFGSIVVLLLISLLGFYFLWKRAKWNKPLKFFISALWAICILIILITSQTPDDSFVDRPIETNSSSSSMGSPSFPITSSSSTTVSSSSQEQVSSGHTDAEPPQISSEAPSAQEPQEVMVWIPKTGKKYHRNSACSNMKNPSQVPLSRAQALGYTACKKCY